MVGEAEDGEGAVAAARELRPDVILMDIRMPGLDGIAATRRSPPCPIRPRILILTTFDLNSYVYEALRAGRQRLPAQGRPARRAAGGRSGSWPAATRCWGRRSPSR